MRMTRILSTPTFRRAPTPAPQKQQATRTRAVPWRLSVSRSRYVQTIDPIIYVLK